MIVIRHTPCLSDGCPTIDTATPSCTFNANIIVITRMTQETVVRRKRKEAEQSDAVVVDPCPSIAGHGLDDDADGGDDKATAPGPGHLRRHEAYPRVRIVFILVLPPW